MSKVLKFILVSSLVLSIIFAILLAIIIFFSSLLDDTDFYKDIFVEKVLTFKILEERVIVDTVYLDNEYKETVNKDSFGNITYIKEYTLDTSYMYKTQDINPQKIDSIQRWYKCEIGNVEYDTRDKLDDLINIVLWLFMACFLFYFILFFSASIIYNKDK
jgi:hypothetical protein